MLEVFRFQCTSSKEIGQFARESGLKSGLYERTTDPLNAIQLGSGVSRAGGNRHYLQSRSIGGTANGHSINSVIETLRTPTIGQQMMNILKQAIIPPKFY